MTTKTVTHYDKSKLSSRQHRFIINLWAGMTQTEAYVKAYQLGDPGTAASCATELLKLPKISQELESLRQKSIDLIGKTIASPFERKQVLTELLRARLTDFLDNAGEPSITKDTPNNRAAKEFYHKRRVDRDGNPIVTKSIKLVDAIAAIQELNKMDGSYAPSKHLVGHRVQFEVKFVDRKNRELPEGESNATE